MGRLISEDDVMRMLTSVELNNGTITDAKSELRNVKTAYDVEKVIADLKEFEEEAALRGASGIVVDMIDVVERGGEE
jgi:hypothetical protein